MQSTVLTCTGVKAARRVEEKLLDATSPSPRRRAFSVVCCGADHFRDPAADTDTDIAAAAAMITNSNNTNNLQSNLPQLVYEAWLRWRQRRWWQLANDGAVEEDEAEVKEAVCGEVTTALTEQLYEYILKHTREPPALKRLREATAAMPGSRMQVTPEQGQLMAMLAQLVGATRAIEVGVYTGYSSACVALALPQDGLLVACENDAKVVKVAEKAWEDAGVRHKVDLRIAPAAETLNKLVEEGQTDSFDLAFVDADKRNYGLYYELLLKLVRPGGLIAIDNVFWYGKVADLQVDDKATVAIRELTDSLFVDERISFTLVPVGDGMALCRRR
eukprot:jgi/Chlat1/1062/Chrsp110S01540